MTRRALFIPGLFVTPQSRKFAAIKETMPEFEWDIADFSPLYRKTFCYDAFTELVRQKILHDKPHHIVTYSFGGTLYQTLVQQQKISEPDSAVLVVPVGNFANSENGRKILSGETGAEHIYQPVHELKVGQYVGRDFFSALAAHGNRAKKQIFQSNLYIISGSLDQDTDPDIIADFKQNSTAGHTLLRDDHRMTRNMPLVCALTRSFLLNG